MKNPYVRILGKKPKREANLEALKNIPRTAELTTMYWAVESTPDMEGNIAVWKKQIDKLKLRDDFTEFAELHETEDGIVYKIPREVTEKYFKILSSEEIYYHTEEEVYEQLERMMDLEIYREFITAVVKVVAEEIREGNKYPDGSILIRRHKTIQKDSDSFYTTYWKCRPSCCGSRCSSCQLFHFPDYSVRAFEKFYNKYKDRYDEEKVENNDVEIVVD